MKLHFPDNALQILLACHIEICILLKEVIVKRLSEILWGLR